MLVGLAEAITRVGAFAAVPIAELQPSEGQLRRSFAAFKTSVATQSCILQGVICDAALQPSEHQLRRVVQ